MKSRLERWLSDRGIDPLDLLGILAFSGFVFGRIYAWLKLDPDGQADRGNLSRWASHTGGLLFAVLMMTSITGLLLAFYYHPTPESAQASLRYLESEVTFGRTIRQVHAWSASLLIFLLFFHVFRCFIWRSYGWPKGLTWFFGSVLLFLSFYFMLTGRLLPWDQYAYWKTVANIEVLWDVPLFGSPLVSILYGGKDVTWLTLIRFYSAHVFVLPMATGAVLFIHFSYLRRRRPGTAMKSPGERDE